MSEDQEPAAVKAKSWNAVAAHCARRSWAGALSQGREGDDDEDAFLADAWYQILDAPDTTP